MFGYDIGISGGVTSMPQFLREFFPVVYKRQQIPGLESNYSQNLIMLIVGRLLLGCGVGFANQAVPLFLSEVAPTRIRGALNLLFQLMCTIGILVANLINYGTANFFTVLPAIHRN
ncbi:hypothetical protein L3X38_002682 [Prunus dulcis]|uniref:Major facilitator superfamily (MFS) profile domain-containing protein n=1 Tax=Prunus dulcis TaxID=3755 RepID=A0AAD4ZLB6_PRUDU|nr:hypothetical protein L3X38_002682 [Prunus dulcis]